MAEVRLSRTRLVFLSLAVASAYVVWGLLISIQPPFYPQEAEKKGATPSQYGFVFGIANLAAFLSAPFFGRYGNFIGPKLLYNTGAYMQAFCGIAFGFLTYIDDANLFIGLSYLLRALSGIFDVAAWNAVVSILIKLFPDLVSRIMSYTEMFFGLGYMLGPALGSALYSAGGFLLPFVVVGSVGVIVATALLVLIPNVKADKREPTEEGQETSRHLSFRELLRHPSILLPFLDNTICFSGNGLIVALMEPHLEEAGANQGQIAAAFLIFGACFAVGSIMAGLITDRVRFPTAISLLGNAILIVTLALVGPLPFLPLSPTVPLLMTTMGLSAFGYAFVMVSSFGRAQKKAIHKGFVQDIDTYLFISGMWSSSFYFGNFFGPTLAGILVDSWGFRNSSTLFWSFYVAIAIVDVVDLVYNIKLSSRTKDYQELL